MFIIPQVGHQNSSVGKVGNRGKYQYLPGRVRQGSKLYGISRQASGSRRIIDVSPAILVLAFSDIT